jgi:hypothetical protein
MSVSEAILRINPDLSFEIENDDYDTVKWLNFDPEEYPNSVPSKDLVLSLAEQIRKEREHILPRVKKYPKIDEQLDMLWHSMDSGEIPKATEWYNKIKEVKESIPKQV